MKSEKQNKAIHVLLVTGYGRSGSTILEMLLSAPGSILGLGSLSLIGKLLDQKARKAGWQNEITCGDMYNYILQELQTNGELFSSLAELEAVESLLTKYDKNDVQRYQKVWKIYYDAACKHQNDVTVCVDKSKSVIKNAKRALLLQQTEGLEVTCIHIIRHPRAVLWRVLKKSRDQYPNQNVKAYYQMIRTMVNWTFSNIWPLFLKRKCKGYTRLSYEVLCKNPEKEIERIGTYCQIDMSETLEILRKDGTLPPTCGLLGNEFRNQQAIRFRPVKQKKHKWFSPEYIFSLFLIPLYYLLTLRERQ